MSIVFRYIDYKIFNMGYGYIFICIQIISYLNRSKNLNKNSPLLFAHFVSILKPANKLLPYTKKVKLISRTKYLLQVIKDNLRPLKHQGYTVNSLYRNKFILQSFIPDLANDWKKVIFGDKYYVLTRHVKKNDFRASGSHTKYLAGSRAILPEGCFHLQIKFLIV